MLSVFLASLVFCSTASHQHGGNIFSPHGNIFSSAAPASTPQQHGKNSSKEENELRKLYQGWGYSEQDIESALRAQKAAVSLKVKKTRNPLKH